MDKEKFNNYCAKVMGYIVHDPNFGEGTIRVKYKENSAVFFYEPYDDLNQLAEVIDSLSVLGKYEPNYKELVNNLVLNIPMSVKHAFREFVISTMNDNKQGE